MQKDRENKIGRENGSEKERNGERKGNRKGVRTTERGKMRCRD